MAGNSEERPIRYEPEEACPLPVALIVGVQGASLVIAPMVLYVAIAIRSSGLDDSHVEWSVFAAMLVCGAVTAAQAATFGRYGAGHVVLTWPGAMFIAIAVGAISAAGPATYASLLFVCSFLHIALGWWLPTLRRIITPSVSGTVTMLVAVSILPVAFEVVGDVPAGATPLAGPAVAGVTLLVLVASTLYAVGSWRLAAPLFGILAGCAAAVPFGLLDGELIAGASWFGIPRTPDLSLDLTPGREFWALLPSFAILTLVLGLKTVSDGVVIQQSCRRVPRAIDFRQVQSMVSVNGFGMLLSAITITLPCMVISSLSVSLVNLTGVATRRVGLVVAAVILALAFFAKFTALVLSIPAPVMGAYLVLAMGVLFVNGIQTLMRDGLDHRRVLVVGLACSLGIGLHDHPIIRDLFGDEMGGLLGSGVTIGAIVAIGMTLLLEASSRRPARLEVTLDMASLPAIDAFLAEIASRLRWNEGSTLRLRSAGEETLASILSLENVPDGENRPRLLVLARPQAGQVELEFVATTRHENIEDQLAFLSDEDAAPTVEDLSLRLLRYHASAVRHQKFHGVDIVTVQVEGSP